ncbi:MAG: hypothetical protein KDD55_04330, partial [Bdellovibrionales bacterium]|nr:hypothetical protein [Bdellovibrionales bacterium]
MARTVRDNSTLSWWLVLLAAVSSILFTFLFARYELDDALIYKRYVDNAFAGQGLVYNVGEYWNALTSPLYAYLFLLLSHVLGSVSYGDVFLRVLSLFVASCGGASLVGLYVENGKDRDLSQASIILLISSSYYFLSTFGLETLLFVGLLGFALVLFAHERYFLLGIVSALLLLTRGESFFLLLLLLLYQIKCKRAWPSWRVFLVPGLILAAHFLFSFAYYGSFTPHTLTAKLAQGASGYWGESLAFAKGIKIYTWYFGHRVSLMFSLALLFCFFGAWRTRAMWQTQAIVGFSFLYAMFFLLFNIPFYHWYYGPFIFFGYLFLVCGVCFCSGALFQRVAALVLVVIVGFQGWYSYQASKSISPHPYVAIG